MDRHLTRQITRQTSRQVYNIAGKLDHRSKGLLMASPKWRTAGSRGAAHHHLRLNRFVDMDPQRLSESFELFKRDQLPMLALVPGFRSVFFGVNLEEGK